MEDTKNLLTALGDRLRALARTNAVVARTISVGDRHVIPLCELTLGLCFGGGIKAGTEKDDPKWTDMGGGGGAKATPVAVIVVDGGKARVESLGR